MIIYMLALHTCHYHGSSNFVKHRDCNRERSRFNIPPARYRVTRVIHVFPTRGKTFHPAIASTRRYRFFTWELKNRHPTIDFAQRDIVRGGREGGMELTAEERSQIRPVGSLSRRSCCWPSSKIPATRGFLPLPPAPQGVCVDEVKLAVKPGIVLTARVHRSICNGLTETRASLTRARRVVQLPSAASNNGDLGTRARKARNNGAL